ncbi:right-handed parallel beta-helix repeat-containing protein [Methanosarcina acetivorans]|uniref:right-handed parallel beta-helix repeat-containing protein n=1 Tax=Methanosarcina acetivorans TaxID=2214 RepID=UPI0012FEA41A|nr:right-handed parallel beta-helix repeat-containing protein [Methanosarcina acetivorans]
MNGIVAIGSAAPTLIYPSADEYVTLDASNSLTFNWTEVDGATNYHLEVSRYSDFHTLTRDRTTTNTYYYVAVEQNATYYWRVSAYVNGNWENPSSYGVFYTFEEPEPLVPTLIYPSADEYVTLDASNSLTFNWTEVDGATNYHLEVSRYPDFHTLTRDRTTTNTYYYVAVEQNATYYWRVSAYVNGDWEEPCNYSVFYTFEEPEPPAPTLIYPSADEYVTLDASNSLTFNWTEVEDATNYHLEVSRYSDFHTLTRDRTTTNTYYYVAVEQNATYYWRVSAYVNGDWEEPCNYSVFYTFEETEPGTGNLTYLTIGPSGCNYTVDGDDDQVQINQALAAVDALGGGTVELVGPFTYDITETILIGDNTRLISTTGAVIRLNDDCMWNSMVPVIGQLDGTYTATHDVEICGLEFDCNEANLTHLGTYDSNNLERKWGKGFYNAIYIRGGTSEANFAYNISIHDNHFYDGMGDSARIFNARNFTYYANEAENMQHATVYCAQVLGADIYDNEIEHITNAGIRFDNSEDAIIHDNILRDYTGTTSAPKYGSEGIQIGNQDAISRLTNNITIYDNDIQGGLDAIQLMDALGTAGTTAQTVLIYNNTIHDSGICTWAKYNGAISVWNWGNGLTIYHNQINDSYGAGILVYNAYSGCTMDVYENNIVGVYDTLATNPTYRLGVTGYGILNYIGSAYMDVNATSNYITGCSTGAYYGVTPTSTASEPNVW